MSSITWVPQPVAARPAALRLTARGRRVVAALALALATATVLSAQGAAAGSPTPSLAVVSHTVVAGETLWQLASGIATPGQDVRDVVDLLVELNGLDGAGLQAGQQVLLPDLAG